MKQALVTGASGFVGKPLCNELLRQGWQVRAAMRSLCQLPNGVESTIIGAIDGKTNWVHALRDVDVVIHLVARDHIKRGQVSDSLAEFRVVNAAGTLNLARQAAGSGVRRFVYLSSIKVNGEQTLPGQPFTESDIPAPLGPYGISKSEAEEGLRKIAQQMGMEVVIIRPPLVYGPGVKANFLNLMRWLQKRVPLPFGAIHNCRSLVSLDNLIDFIITCLDHPAAANQTFLVSDGEDISTTELLRRLAAVLDVPVRLLPVSQKLLEMSLNLVGKGDLAQRLCGSLQVDISKACSMLGWKPIVSLEDGLRRAAEDFLRRRA